MTKQHTQVRKELDDDRKSAHQAVNGLGAVHGLPDYKQYWQEKARSLDQQVEHFDTRTLFVFPNLNTNISWSPAIQTLCAYLRKKGYSSDVSHLSAVTQKGLDELLIDIKEYEPSVVGFTATSFEFGQTNEMAKRIKALHPELPVILGGIHATLNPDNLQGSSFDGFCIGEGETPMVDLVGRLERKEDYTSTPGFMFKREGKIVNNGTVPFIKDLEDIGPMDWDVFDTGKILDNRNGWLSIGFSRGCPYLCTFCVNGALREVKGKKW